MTSDAKVGLLLGLVFIVIIAFLINGLPNLLNADDSREVITNSVSEPNNNWGGLRDQASEVVRTVDNLREDVRFNTTGNTETETITPPASMEVTTINSPVSSPPTAIITPPATTIAVIKKYTVASGDNLSTIALKSYGAEEGNRLVNINKIFNANKDILDSPDDVRIGQKLIIPPLNMPQFELVTMPVKPSVSAFEKVKTALNNITAKIELPRYTTRDGDSLWSIAASKLGDGNRYHEIVKLNKLEDEDTVGVGITLKLPKH
jgi:nucleoid-associated protein YgaU